LDGWSIADTPPGLSSVGPATTSTAVRVFVQRSQKHLFTTWLSQVWLTSRRLAQHAGHRRPIRQKGRRILHKQPTRPLTFESLLIDPLVRLIMDADGVSADQLALVMRRARDALDARTYLAYSDARKYKNNRPAHCSLRLLAPSACQ
jgi:hypothetical protein